MISCHRDVCMTFVSIHLFLEYYCLMIPSTALNTCCTNVLRMCELASLETTPDTNEPCSMMLENAFKRLCIEWRERRVSPLPPLRFPWCQLNSSLRTCGTSSRLLPFQNVLNLGVLLSYVFSYIKFSKYTSVSFI